jgi:mannose-6-phosphate isomerase-like protein (cupin superfamily)
MTRAPLFMALVAAVMGLSTGSQRQAQPAPEPNHTAHWTGAELKAVETTELAPRAKAPDSAILNSKALLDVPTHRMSLVHRVVDGYPEVHAGETDIWIIQSGSGGVVIGGEIVGREAAGRGGAGTVIRGGQRFKAVVGDTFNIPPNIPHQALVDAGKSLTYLLIKVRVAKTSNED